MAPPSYTRYGVEHDASASTYRLGAGASRRASQRRSADGHHQGVAGPGDGVGRRPLPRVDRDLPGSWAPSLGRHSGRLRALRGGAAGLHGPHRTACVCGHRPETCDVHPPDRSPVVTWRLRTGQCGDAVVVHRRTPGADRGRLPGRVGVGAGGRGGGRGGAPGGEPLLLGTVAPLPEPVRIGFFVINVAGPLFTAMVALVYFLRQRDAATARAEGLLLNLP